ncbi:hypothetical protein LCGC14_3107800 [marine sediment metagenome]|uniref:Uncharacterized protein n=1 Tax=marine sediment metagenome TaxID=412755 RepID=A0A0F8W653_9ZZZZ
MISGAAMSLNRSAHENPRRVRCVNMLFDNLVCIEPPPWRAGGSKVDYRRLLVRAWPRRATAPITGRRSRSACDRLLPDSKRRLLPNRDTAKHHHQFRSEDACTPPAWDELAFPAITWDYSGGSVLEYPAGLFRVAEAGRNVDAGGDVNGPPQGKRPRNWRAWPKKR